MNYKERIYEKMSAEYKAFIERVKRLPGEEAIEHGYEKVFKEDIISCVEDMELSPKQARALLTAKEPLNDLYSEWLRSDYSYMDILGDSISDTIKIFETIWRAERNGAR